MLIYEYKLDGNQQQEQAIEEAIRITQFIRNKCLRLWMDGRGVSRNDLRCHCAVLAREYAFASLLNSQARQVAAERAWDAISRFYEHCKNKKPVDSPSLLVLPARGRRASGLDEGRTSRL